MKKMSLVFTLSMIMILNNSMAGEAPPPAGATPNSPVAPRTPDGRGQRYRRVPDNRPDIKNPGGSPARGIPVPAPAPGVTAAFLPIVFG